MFPIMILLLVGMTMFKQSLAIGNIQIQQSPASGPILVGNADKFVFDSKTYFVSSFLGIPYAENVERFSIAQPYILKSGVLDCTKFGAICPQNPATSNGACYRTQVQNEKCHFLNVYRPVPDITLNDLENAGTESGRRIVLKQTKKLYPIYIFIHGGFFTEGNGNCYDGSVIAGFGDVIVVTINYRLGALGFLTTNDSVMPTNLALRDQMTAIEWVKKHAYLFSGDPDRITVGGQSAGSIMTVLHGLNPRNDKLFQRMIAESGTPLIAKQVSKAGKNTTLAVAQLCNCSVSGSSEELRSCLRAIPVEQLINVIAPMLIPAVGAYTPMVDGDTVPLDPYVAFSKVAQAYPSKNVRAPTCFAQKDLLIGSNGQDGEVAYRANIIAIVGGDLTRYVQVMSSPVNTTILAILLKLFLLKSYTDTVRDSVIRDIIYKYTTTDDPNLQSNLYMDLVTDPTFDIPTTEAASLHAQPDNRNIACRISENAPIFLTILCSRGIGNTQRYLFTHLPPPNYQGMPWFTGTGHSQEIPFLFSPLTLTTDADKLLSKRMLTYWTNFIKSGNANKGTPSNSGHTTNADAELPYWPLFNNDNQSYLHLGIDITVGQHLRQDYNTFWTEKVPELLRASQPSP